MGVGGDMGECWGRCEKVFWGVGDVRGDMGGVGKCWGGVGKCVGVWEGVLECGGGKERCGDRCGGACSK